MPGTSEGSIKAQKTLKERYGEDYFKTIGKKGGEKSNPYKGFGSNPELASKAGKKGGAKSRRTK